MKKFIVSIDQGTTSTKVVLYNKNFHVIDTLQKEFKQFFPKNGWVEHDPIEIFKDVKFLIKKLIKKNDIKCSEILSIGIANQRETTVLWDKLSGKPVYKAIVWQDRRTISICEKLINKKIDSMKIFLGIEYTAFLIFAILMTIIFLSLWIPAMVHTAIEFFIVVFPELLKYWTPWNRKNIVNKIPPAHPNIEPTFILFSSME